MRNADGVEYNDGSISLSRLKRINPTVGWIKPQVPRKMNLEPKCILVQKERNLDAHHPIIKLVTVWPKQRVLLRETHG
jgi:hypothetical protein